MKLASKAARDAFTRRDLEFSDHLYGNLIGRFGLSNQDWIRVLQRDTNRAAEAGRFFYQD